MLSRRSAHADQENFVSMGMNGALKGRQILENAHAVLGIALMAAAQSEIRKHVEFLDVERPLYTDHNTMAKLVKGCRVLTAVEQAVGPLGVDMLPAS